MMGHKVFFEGRVKTKKGTLSEEVTKKDIRTGFRVEFVRRIGTQPGKTQKVEDTEFGWVKSFVE